MLSEKFNPGELRDKDKANPGKLIHKKGGLSTITMLFTWVVLFIDG